MQDCLPVGNARSTSFDCGEEIFLSVVIPVYQAETILPELCHRLAKTLSSVTDHFEMILVDDRSQDRSWEVLESLTTTYPELAAIRLSRNFGQHYATTAGLDLSRGAWVIVMDCDLQDQPEVIPQLLQSAQQGFDVVLARRLTRQHTAFQQLGSRSFWTLFGFLSGFKVDSSIGSFRIMRRSVVDAYCQCREGARIFGGLVHWLGFRVTTLDVDHGARYDGSSSYTIRKLVRMAVDGIISFSNRPLYVSIFVGAMISMLAGLYGSFYLIRYMIWRLPTSHGWLSVVTLVSFLGGLILLNQGILGLYIARIYDESKKRPIYVIDRIVPGATLRGRMRCTGLTKELQEHRHG
jgi:polyisoprenyl-phosphate glycosyltransferase